MFLLIVLPKTVVKCLRWEQIKTEERAQKAQHSALDDIPRSLPALMRAQKIQKRCANVGFDWTTLGPVVDKSTKRSTR